MLDREGLGAANPAIAGEGSCGISRSCPTNGAWLKRCFWNQACRSLLAKCTLQLGCLRSRLTLLHGHVNSRGRLQVSNLCAASLSACSFFYLVRWICSKTYERASCSKNIVVKTCERASCLAAAGPRILFFSLGRFTKVGLAVSWTNSWLTRGLERRSYFDPKSREEAIADRKLLLLKKTLLTTSN